MLTVGVYRKNNKEISNMVEIHDSVEAASKAQKAQAHQDAAMKESLEKIKHKLLVMSGKGGVGKTSTSVNLAIALSNKGFKVGILDVDLHGPDVPRMLGLKGVLDLSENQKLKPQRYSDNLKAVSVESLIASKDDAIIWRGPIKYSAITQFIGQVEWDDLDFLIIDAPPGTGDEPLTIAQVIPDARAVIVTTPQEVALADVRKSINFCRKVQMNILGLVENMSGFACPHCGETIDLFGSGGGQKTAAVADIAFLGKIPFDLDMVACGDSGISFQEKNTESPVTKAFADLAASIAQTLNR